MIYFNILWKPLVNIKLTGVSFPKRDGGWVKIKCIYVLEGKVNEHICMHYLNGINNQKGQNEGIKLLNWM